MNLNWNDWFSRDPPTKRFATHEALFEGLKNTDNAAILYAQIKVLPAVKKLVKGYGLPAMQVDEVLNQSTLILLRKITDGSYQFQNKAPTTYLVEIARRVALMATRNNKRTTDSLDNHYDLLDEEIQTQQARQEAAEQVAHLLGKIGSPCDTIIRLKYIDGYTDEEIVNQRFTKYSTVDSLKVKRSDCMKKLTQIAQQVAQE